MKTITGNLSYRKQYALQCILKDIRSRSFDNCFEMGDGDEVVRFIMKKATEHIEPVPENFKKIAKQEKLIRILKERGFWEPWYKFTFSDAV